MGVGHFYTENGVKARTAQSDGGPLREVGSALSVRYRTCLPAANGEQQLGCPLDRSHLPGRIDAALEAQRSVRVQPETARPTGDRGWSEEGALEQNGVRRRADRRRLAAHDAGQSDGPARVCDHEHVFGERDVAAVQERQVFVRTREPRLDTAVELGEIVGVQRLAALDHDVVRHVDDRLNRPKPGTSQPLAHPQWSARVGLEPAQHAARESRAARARTERNGEGFGDRGGDGRRIAVPEFHVAPRGKLARDTDDAEAVAAVRRDVDLEHRVVQTQVVGNGSAFRRIGVENQ